MNDSISMTVKGAAPSPRSATRIRSAGRPNRPTTTTVVATAPLTVYNHPLARRHYRVATVAIEAFVDLVEHCVRMLIPGALIHARARMGKTYAIDYVALHLARHRPDVLVLRMSCEHHRSGFEGPFFSTLLSAAGVSIRSPGRLPRSALR